MRVFTGIVHDIGRVAETKSLGGDVRLVVETDRLSLEGASIGDSIAVGGVCLTVTQLAGKRFAADVSRETLARSTLGTLQQGSPVNLEPALRAGDALGGHLVSGHIDAVATVVRIEADARSRRMTFAVPAPLMRYVAVKGSITVDGVSLTVNEVDAASFGVNLVPHTLEVTTLGRLAAGQPVNLEVDQVARYVERLLGRDA
jgi:riboflavin synthase